MKCKIYAFFLLGIVSSNLKSMDAERNAILRNQAIASIKKMHKAIDADPALTSIATDAIGKCGLNPEEFIILKQEDGGNADVLHNQKFITLGAFNKFEDQIRFTAYHECGHHYYNDPETNIKKRLESQSLLALGSVASIVGSYMFGPESALGKVAVTSSGMFLSLLGGVYYFNQTIQSQEMRADTFACEKLIKNNQIGPVLGFIIDNIEKFEKDESAATKALPFETHPCAYERAQNCVARLRKAGYNLNNIQGISPQMAQLVAKKVNKYFPE